MPECVYQDLTPGFTDVKDETWAEATAAGVREIMEEFSSVPNPKELSTRELAASVVYRPIEGYGRLLLDQLAPELLQALDKEAVRSLNRD